ncbi:MAG: type I glyceraldehyde-3-phosphate dehydrogenase [Planctomycetes bacterium]|nr:type I glyceraldehyde-3-phosphate dehydrogenase [Planctomycetota bacterium]
MAIRVAINGFGRIGRLVFRVMQQRGAEFEVVHINDLADADTMAHFLKYDTVHGRFNGTVAHTETALTVNKKAIDITKEKDPANLPWKSKEVDFVVESTGVFRSRDKCAIHLNAGAKRVLLTVPAKDAIDATIVLGVNDDTLKSEHKIISNASCTTNCLAPMVKVLNDSFGIEEGLMTTVHAYTNDQRVADLFHDDLRRGRAAAANIIPTTTGAAKAVGEVIPSLKGKLNGMAMRVPVPDGSIVDFVVKLKNGATKDSVNAAMKVAAEGTLAGVLEYTEDEIVSSDVIGNAHSCIFDAQSTMTISDKFVKVIGWYDNEWGYSNRVVDLIAKAARM